jgi:phosphoesterase RecJ-like protein
MEHLLKASRVLVLGHQHPDGDALGAGSALASILRHLGKTALVGISGRVPPNITFLVEPAKYFVDVTELDPEAFKHYDLLIYVDCHGPSRVWPDAGQDLWDRLPPNLVIDHHIHNAELQGVLAVFHDKGASSTGELIARLARDLGVRLPVRAVEALLAAIVSDTGFFTQDNAQPSTLREAADLVEQGARLARLHERINCGFSLTRMRLLKNSLETMDVFLEGKVAVMLLTGAMLEDAKARIEDSDGFIDFPRSLAGVMLAAFIKEDGHGGIKVSLRSKPPVSARAIAQCFGGGGHEVAAAYTDRAPSPEQARDRFLEVASRFILGE